MDCRPCCILVKFSQVIALSAGMQEKKKSGSNSVVVMNNNYFYFCNALWYQTGNVLLKSSRRISRFFPHRRMVISTLEWV